MKFTTRLRESLAAFKMSWQQAGSTYGGFGGWQNVAGWPVLAGTLPGTQLDLLKEVRDPALNSAVSICLNWVGRQLPEPDLQVCRRQRDAELVPVPRHPMCELVETPNPHYDGDALWMATSASYLVAGNAYWLKERDRVGRPARLWYVSHWEIQPRWPQDGSAFLTDYLYRPGGIGPGYAVQPEDVVHFRFGLNPYLGGRVGVSPVYPLLREVLQDNEAASYMAALLKNMAIPGSLVSPGSDSLGSMPPEAAKDLEARWQTKFTGDNRAKVLVANNPMKVDQLAITPEQMVLDKVRQIPEDRICAAFGINPMVAGLTSGAAHKTYANYQEARSAAYEDCVLPMLCRFALTLERMLLPDFEGATPVRTTRRRDLCCNWDTSKVQCLQEDLDAKHKRARDDYAGGLLTRNEARQVIGMPAVEEVEEETTAHPGFGDDQDQADAEQAHERQQEAAGQPRGADE